MGSALVVTHRPTAETFRDETVLYRTVQREFDSVTIET
jgi:hypothetical protein